MIRPIIAQRIPFDTVVIFGDSDSDTGNVFNLTGQLWPPTPYYAGRFTNGLVWADRLDVSMVVNYAYGGATTDNTFIRDLSVPESLSVPGVRQQISTYLSHTNLSQMSMDHTLFVIWIAANDFTYNSMVPPVLVVNSLLDSINVLLQARVQQLMIANLAPLQAMPLISAFNADEYFIYLTQEYNRNLSKAIDKLKAANPSTSLRLFNLNSAISKIITNPSRYSILNTRDNCWATLNGTIIVLCDQPDDYVFIDEIHYTTRVHEILATEIRRFLASSSANRQQSILKLMLGIAILRRMVAHFCF